MEGITEVGLRPAAQSDFRPVVQALEVRMSQVSSFADGEAPSELVLEPFACSSEADGAGAVRLYLSGELDFATLFEFRQALRAAQSNATIVELDLRSLTFIDCSALQAILDADAIAQRTGGRLVLVRGTGQVDRVMALTGLLARIEVSEDSAPFAARSLRVPAW
ncbi:MAG: STAS domain-containing protein [Solirubrobacterales bacterium]